MACYDGNYPVPYDANVDKQILERRRQHLETVGETLQKEEKQFKLL
jgi:hypothetical protein